MLDDRRRNVISNITQSEYSALINAQIRAPRRVEGVARRDDDAMTIYYDDGGSSFMKKRSAADGKVENGKKRDDEGF